MWCVYIYFFSTIYSGLLFSHEKEGSPTICITYMDLESIRLSEISWTKTNILYYLYAESKKAELLKTESRRVVRLGSQFLLLFRLVLWSLLLSFPQPIPICSPRLLTAH